MSTQTFTMEAQPRALKGTRAARRLRAQGRLPANIYGHKQAGILVTLDAKEFRRFLDAGHRIVTLRVEGEEEQNVVKEVQYDAFGQEIIHVDFTRISADESLEMEVPVEMVGVSKGVSGGGVLEFPMKDLLVRGKPADLPEHFEINVEPLEVGQSLRIKDLEAPRNCEFVQDPELVVLQVVAAREEEPVAAAEDDAAQPEVIGKKKEDSEEEDDGK